jgi:hypothetical protein
MDWVFKIQNIVGQKIALSTVGEISHTHLHLSVRVCKNRLGKPTRGKKMTLHLS